MKTPEASPEATPEATSAVGGWSVVAAAAVVVAAVVVAVAVVAAAGGCGGSRSGRSCRSWRMDPSVMTCGWPAWMRRFSCTRRKVAVAADWPTPCADDFRRRT